MSILWIIGAGTESVPGIKKAKAMGLHVVACDGDPNAPGFDFADEKIVISTYDVDNLVTTARTYHHDKAKIDGVICMSTDVPVSVAAITDMLGLPGISLETAQLSADKISMKNHLRAKGIPTPWYKEISSAAELKSTLKSGYYVIKPVDSRGARGVLRITNTDDLGWVFDYSMQFSPSGRVMVEEYLEGPQISTEALVIDSIGYPIGFSDRNYERLEQTQPFIVEDGGGFPTHLSAKQKEEIEKTSIDAGIALGVSNGVVKGDMVWTKEGAKVIEIAPRLSGGWFSTDQIPVGTGVDLIAAAIDLALGRDINPERLIPTKNIGIAIRYFFPEPGTLKEISSKEDFDKKKWVHKLQHLVCPGDVISQPENHPQRAGYVITTGETAQEARERAQQVVKHTHFKV
ncbi:ATP-grasp domain-containing protein [Neptuniibacter sp.]|uniref:ATP-grasp domain-containing protein n=1 Tax=Neptuniibacter sp. TaxID=1962643 RepID=UPI002613C07E|nr:ATP-grasp domain-containing protein [Neptuniibacter sp.]MCP4595910.1 ATP-grasp domain-containing protein [Neptuniibacter sp.]